jgi:dephospho-CoA kinase
MTTPEGVVRRPVRIGLTGPIGCGKSTVAGWLAQEGARVIDADRVAREVTPPGSPELAAIVADFGPGVLLPDGSLDRAALGRIVFADEHGLRRLEGIVHPAVRPRILALLDEAVSDGVEAVVIEAIKLVEGGLASLCDEVWLVTCEPADQLARAEARAVALGQDPRDAAARIAAQGSITARLMPFATRMIDTSGSEAGAKRRVLRAWAEATKRDS